MMNIDDVEENKGARQQANLPYPLPFLMDIRQMRDITFKAIVATAQQNQSGQFTASALLIDGVHHAIIAREAKKFDASGSIFKVFDDETKALKWLSGNVHAR